MIDSSAVGQSKIWVFEFDLVDHHPVEVLGVLEEHWVYGGRVEAWVWVAVDGSAVGVLSDETVVEL